MYPGSVKDAEWSRINRIKKRSRKIHSKRSTVNAILYIIKTGASNARCLISVRKL